MLHNAVLRKCKWFNYGFTVEQEGDSYSFVFYVSRCRSTVIDGCARLRSCIRSWTFDFSTCFDGSCTHADAAEAVCAWCVASPGPYQLPSANHSD